MGTVMKTIILAAGYGTRLSPLSDYLPKPLIPILGRPLLWHILRKLRGCGITEAGVNIHHHADQVRQFLQDEDFGINITVSYESDILGVAGGIGAFREFLKHEEFFMIHNGDILSTIPIDQMAAAYQKKRSLITMVLHDYPPYNNVSLAADGTICDIRDTLKPLSWVKKLAYTGLAFMDAGMLPLIPESPGDLIPLCLEIIRKGAHRIDAIIADGYEWRDVGTVKSYFEVHRDILCRKKPLIAEVVIPPDGIYIEEDTLVADGVQFKGFASVGKRCILRKKSSLENAILWDDVIIEEGVNIKNSIVGRAFQANAE